MTAQCQRLLLLALVTIAPAIAIAGTETPPPTDLPPIAVPQGTTLKALSLDAFSFHSGDSLKATLMRWGEGAGWSVVWELGGDYQIEPDYAFPAGTSFKDAVRFTVEAFQGRKLAPKACVYLRNQVLVVRARGDACAR